MRNAFLFIVLSGIWAGGASAAASDRGAADAGRALVELHCSACHAVGAEGASPIDAAPPFRSLHRRYPIEHLAEALGEGIATGHPGMPEFKLEPEAIDDVLAYLRSLKP